MIEITTWYVVYELDSDGNKTSGRLSGSSISLAQNTAQLLATKKHNVKFAVFVDEQMNPDEASDEPIYSAMLVIDDRGSTPEVL